MSGKTTCYACSDPATKTYRKRPVCDECFDELALGKIADQNIHFIGGISASKDADDNNPWQSNAIRAMEDNPCND